MEVAKEATAKIQNQDLDFTIQHSGITEIDEMLFSVDQMRAALKESLESQWKMEKNKRDQISAMAHDIKTPLTIIHGNTALLDETEQTSEQQQCTNYILSAANQ
ncbi:His Kinase A (phospho-acceptor) domain-containing protein [Hathewaya proteolytica DSM 3090]|uniref:histidine kinase n=1 Tax=Hathewaya proteolytica DSM 3090 TaxID=1121331 RepID=A0A1M6RCF8_9CLOT|nr:histidine kinase dimerization/phospho-acceptor domain-containing protein [Hathewaya proteolytica]SHK30027.1 His Kinase A (phospho-acceptor) domain-containing protein [Hathewaya proteolytica DSM 3090]